MTRTVVSLFSGMGGLDLGFELAGFKVVWANDISEEAVETYQTNFGLRPVLSPIQDLDVNKIPASDIIIGGPPCQAFSLVGRRDPQDPRGALVFDFIRVIEQKLPPVFVMENVPGIAASRISGVRLTDVITQKFKSIGYQVTFGTVTATEFGVPQKRRRVIMIGALGFSPSVPSKWSFAANTDSMPVVTADEAIGDLGACVPSGALANYRTDFEPSSFAKLMRLDNESGVSLHECPRMSDTDVAFVNSIPPGGNYMDVPDDIATERILRFKKSGGRTTTYGRLHPERPAYTINTYFRRPNVGANFHYSEPRLITPREAMRLQSIPDRFTVIATAQDRRNALIGNAVPPLMAQGIAMSIKNQLDSAAVSKMIPA